MTAEIIKLGCELSAFTQAKATCGVGRNRGVTDENGLFDLAGRRGSCGDIAKRLKS
jgi:hypothetical protein